MSTLPVIVAPYQSGVTQQDLNKALANLIVDRIHDLGRDLTLIGAEYSTLGTNLQRDDVLTDNELARALRVIDTLADRLSECRLALQHRGEALQSERAKSAALSTDHHLKLSA